MATVSYKITASNYNTAKTIQCKIGDTISITTSTSYGSSSNDTYGIISMRTTSGNVTLPIISGCSFTVVTSNSYTRINSLSGTISSPGTSTLVMGYLHSTSAYGVKGANLTIVVPYTSTLKYNANGGSGAPSSQSIEHTTTNNQTHRISSTIPTRDGYKFLGWSTSSTATTASYQPRDTISLSFNGSTTLYAVWAREYTSTLKYDANGGSGAPSTQTITETTTTSKSHTISSTVPTKDGYKFLGWSTSSTATTAEYQPGGTISVGYNSTMTLYAVWEKAAPSIPVKVSGSWKDSAPKTKVSGSWRDIIKVFMKINGTWKQHK